MLIFISSSVFFKLEICSSWLMALSIIPLCYFLFESFSYIFFPLCSMFSLSICTGTSYSRSIPCPSFTSWLSLTCHLASLSYKLMILNLFRYPWLFPVYYSSISLPFNSSYFWPSISLLLALLSILVSMWLNIFSYLNSF